MDLQRISSPPTRDQKLAVLPLASAKAQMRVRSPDEDSLIQDYIVAAYDHLFGYDGWTNGYCPLAESYALYATWGLDLIDIPLRPISDVSLVSLSTLSADGTYADADTALYATSLNSGFLSVAPVAPRFWPTPYPIGMRAVRIEFDVGMPAGEDIPAPLVQAMRMLVADWFVNREDTITRGSSPAVSDRVANGLVALAGRYRVSPDHS